MRGRRGVLGKNGEMGRSQACNTAWVGWPTSCLRRCAARGQTPNAKRQTANAKLQTPKGSHPVSAFVWRLAFRVWRLALSRPQGHHAPPSRTMFHHSPPPFKIERIRSLPPLLTARHTPSIHRPRAPLPSSPRTPGIGRRCLRPKSRAARAASSAGRSRRAEATGAGDADGTSLS